MFSQIPVGNNAPLSCEGQSSSSPVDFRHVISLEESSLFHCQPEVRIQTNSVDICNYVEVIRAECSQAKWKRSEQWLSFTRRASQAERDGHFHRLKSVVLFEKMLRLCRLSPSTTCEVFIYGKVSMLIF